MKEAERRVVVSSLLWKLLERSGSQGIQFIVQIILARILTPNDFGIIAIVNTFIFLAIEILQSGISSSLIQKERIDELDYSSAFVLNLSFSIILYVIIFISAPLISGFYNMPVLVIILRIYGIAIIFAAINSILNAKIQRNMQFKKQFISSSGAIILSGAISIVMALNGFGLWSMLVQQIVLQFSLIVINYKILAWFPAVHISFSKAKQLAQFGWKVSVSTFSTTFFNNIKSLLIGKTNSASALAYYNRGDQIPAVIVSNISGSMRAVMLPTLSRSQNNKVNFIRLVRMTISTTTFFVFPIMFGIVAIAEPLVVILLTEKWLATVPFLQVFALNYIFMPLHTTNLQALIAIGRSDISLKYQTYKNVIGVAFLVLTYNEGALAIAIGGMLTTVLSAFLDMYPNKIIIGYKYREQLRDILPSFGLSLTMFILISPLKYLGLTIVETVVLQVAVGVFTYLGLASLLKMKELTFFLSLLKTYLIK